MGAAYVLTGSINQSCVESGTSPLVREMLCKTEQSDVAMAPGEGRYTIVTVESSRGMPGTLIHLAADPRTQQPRVIGLYRR